MTYNTFCDQLPIGSLASTSCPVPRIYSKLFPPQASSPVIRIQNALHLLFANLASLHQVPTSITLLLRVLTKNENYYSPSFRPLISSIKVPALFPSQKSESAVYVTFFICLPQQMMHFIKADTLFAMFMTVYSAPSYLPFIEQVSVLIC